MTPEDFVRVVKFQTSDSAVPDVVSQLERSSGRKPGERALALSKWYKALAPSDQAILLEVVRETAESVAFGFFCILDGVRSIEDGTNKGVLELRFIRGEEQTLLNDPAATFLHDLYKAESTD